MYAIAHSHYHYRMNLTFLSSTLLSELSTHTSFPFICFDYKMNGHLDGQLKKCPIALITCPSLIGLIASHHVQLDVFANGTRPVFSWAGVLFWSSWFFFYLFIYFISLWLFLPHSRCAYLTGIGRYIFFVVVIFAVSVPARLHYSSDLDASVAMNYDRRRLLLGHELMNQITVFVCFFVFFLYIHGGLAPDELL